MSLLLNNKNTILNYKNLIFGRRCEEDSVLDSPHLSRGYLAPVTGSAHPTRPKICRPPPPTPTPLTQQYKGENKNGSKGRFPAPGANGLQDGCLDQKIL